MDDRTMAPEQKGNPSAQPSAPGDYRAPDVDAVLTPEELEREVHYAGEATAVAK